MNKIYQAGPWVTDEDIKIVVDALQNGWYDHPYDYVMKFEQEYAAFHGRKFGVMMSNCTSSLHVLLLSLGIKPGDEIIAPDVTWIGSTACITYCGATPVFADIDEKTWCISPQSIKKNITKKTKAVIVVNLYGSMAPMDEIKKICDDHGLYLIEDAAESLGSKYNGVRSGKFGVGSVFSFHRTKTLTTGEGGMLLVDDEKLYESAWMYRDHGRPKNGKTYVNLEVTPKYMPFNVQAALGYAQFKRIEQLLDKKRWMFAEYYKRLKNVDGLTMNPQIPGAENIYWDPTIVWDKSFKINKEEFIQKMIDQGLLARPFFYPLSSIPAYKKLKDRVKYEKSNKVSYDISTRGVNLPCALNLEVDQIEALSNGIKKILRKEK